MVMMVLLLGALLVVACESAEETTSKPQNITQTSDTPQTSNTPADPSQTPETQPDQVSTSTITPTTSSSAAPALYLAENVILGTSLALADSDTPILDAKTKVLAASILLTSNADEKLGRLKSDNLKDALKNEVAIDLKTSLPGSTWKVENLDSFDYRCEEDPSGNVIKFNKDSISLVKGVASALAVATNCVHSPEGVVTYKLISSSFLYITLKKEFQSEPKSGLVQVVEATPNSMILISHTSGQFTRSFASILTRITD
jgi:hypothetical protein